MVKIVIYLEEVHQNRQSFAVFNDANELIEWQLLGDVTLLTSRFKEAQIILLVPSYDVTFNTITLPHTSAKKARLALPFALEESLIDDIETLHFVLLYREDNQYTVAVIKQDKIAHWRTRVKTWGYELSQVIPVSLALPFTPHRYEIWISDEVHVRTGLFSGFSVNTLLAPAWLNLSIAENPPQEIFISCFSGQNIKDQLMTDAIISQINYPAAEFVRELAKSALLKSSVNLLRDNIKEEAGSFSWQWFDKRVRYAFSFLMILLLAFPLFSFGFLSYADHQLQAQIAVLAEKNLNQEALENPKKKMQEKLIKLMSFGAKDRLLVLLADLNKAKKQQKEVSFTRFLYDHQQLTLEMKAASEQFFSKFIDALVREGLKVKQQNVNLVNENVEATLIIG